MSDGRIAVVGAGIVGLAVARALLDERPGSTVVVLEKEDRVGAHQTGHNSGVVHAGLYYQPGSLKADLCRRGRVLLRDYCAGRGIDYRELGKVVVATSAVELPALAGIEQRARANGVPRLARLDPAGLRAVEPWVTGVAALHSPETAVVDFTAVARAFASDVAEAGGEVRLGHRVDALIRVPGGWRIGAEVYGNVIVCAGLGTDAVARRLGGDDRVTTVPFRGEYYRLTTRLRDRIRGLVYPVPDPRYPFLGVHLTRRWDDEVLVGPNAVLALAAEGYRRGDVDLRHLLRVLRWPGFPRLVVRNWRAGVREIATSMSRRAFAAAARRYLPELTAADLVRAPAGVRAQAMDRRGALIDDFVVEGDSGLVLVRNAPSPAATSSLAIAEHIVQRVVAALS
ncbi:L-2-hydroxyglutarate oxidase [Micromonospora sp. NPDC005087]|uniref:L-2-hydroxyglutarate oxidase n=1 Tax=Micromonospora sp. NPDC005087 TaxID=3364225 RepID=UPI00368D82D6